MVLNAIYASTLQILEEKGFAGLELTEVAQRANVNKTTIYRRWSNKSALLLEMLSFIAKQQVTGRDTGALLTDLIALLQDIQVMLRSRAIRALLAASIDVSLDATAVSMRRAFFNERFERSGEIIRRAVARGDLPKGADSRLILEDACSAVYFRLLITGDDISDDDLRLFAQRAILRAV